MYVTETVRRSGGRMFTDRVIAVKRLFRKPLDPQRAAFEVRRVNRLLQCVLDCFRLYKPGRLYFGGILHRRATREGAIDVFPRQWPESPLVLYPLEGSADIGGLRQLWRAMRSKTVRGRQYLELARRWYSSSADANRIEDRVISLMTAAEALFQIGPDEQRKGERMAEKAVALGVQSVAGEDVSSQLRASYDLRNHIIHRGHAGHWRNGHSDRPTAAEVEQFVQVTSETIRSALVVAIQGLAEKPRAPAT